MANMMERLIDDFVQHLRLERGLSPNSLAAYQSDLREFVKRSGQTDPSRLSPRAVTDFFSKLARMGRKPATLARKISALKHFFEYLKDNKLISDSPARAYSAPKIVRYHPDYLSPQEIEKVIKASASDPRNGIRNRAVIEMLYGSGLRISELIHLKQADIEFEAGFIRITGKGNKQRIVPLGGLAKQALNHYLENQISATPAKSSPWLFPGRNGKTFSRAGMWKIIRNLVRKAGISKKVTPHTFRHSFATHLIEGGADLRTLQEMLGHADISTTEIYTRIDRDYIVAEHRKHHPRERGRSPKGSKER